jgi:hypothetical protein
MKKYEVRHKLTQDIVRLAELVERLTAAEAAAENDVEIALHIFDHADLAASEIVASERRTPERIGDVVDTALRAPKLDYHDVLRDPEGRTAYWRQDPSTARGYQFDSDGTLG